MSLTVSAVSQNIPLHKFVSLVFQGGSPLLLAKLFALPLIAGYSVFACKKWSYPVFLGVMGYTMIDNILTWRAFPQSFSLITLLGVDVLNLATVSYFLIPAVRTTYFNPRIRWWESKPRYQVNFWGRMDRLGKTASCRISDLSEGGVFLEIANQAPVQIDEPVLLQFSFFNLDVSAQGRVLHKSVRGNVQGLGIMFEGLSPAEFKALRSLTAALDLLAFDQRQEATDWKTDFKNWARGVFTSGEGLVPQVPRFPKTAPKTTPPQHAAEAEQSDQKAA